MPDHVDRIVQAWRRERPDLDLAALVLLGRLFRTAHLADTALAKPLAAHGPQPGRFDPDPNDRRGTLVRLTSRSKTTIDTAPPGHLSNEQQLLASLSPA